MPVAIYARSSSDPDDKRISVEAQLARCRRKAAELHPGEPVVPFIDNDISAHDPDAVRPGFDAFVEAVRADEITAVIVNEQSRLTRRSEVWSALAVTLYRAGILEVLTLDKGPVSVAEGNRLVGGLLALIDEEEAARAKIRTRNAHAEIARQGRPSGVKPYGYQWGIGDDGRAALEVDPDQAEIVTRMIDWVLAGVPTHDIARRLNAEKVPTPRGGARWRPQSVTSVLTSASIAGLRRHGPDLHLARWPAIVDRERWDRIQVMIGSRRGRRSGQRSWLTGGLIVCGVCGAPLVLGVSSRRPPTPSVRAYVCHPNSGVVDACRGVTISPATSVDDVVAEVVLALVDTEEVRRRLAPSDVDRRAELAVEVSDAESAIAEAAQLRGEGVLDRQQFDAVVRPARHRAEQARAELDRLLASDLVPTVDDVRDRWAALTVPQRRAVAEIVLAGYEVAVSPARPGLKRFDPDRISVRPRSPA